MASFFTSVWEGLKKTPGWALFALLFMGALVWNLYRASQRHKRAAEIVREILSIDKEFEKELSELESTSKAERSKITLAYSKKIELLKQEEDEIALAAAGGAKKIANEWAKFLGERKNG